MTERVSRRRAIGLVGGAAAGLTLGGALVGGAAAHTPYRQWVVYRKKHLLIGCHREDPATYAQAKAIVAALDAHLPAARARVARAPRPDRLASLLGTDQMQLAVLDPATARRMELGAAPFEAFGPVALRTLMRLEGISSASAPHVLVARAAFPDAHATAVASALVAAEVGSEMAPG